MPRKDDTRTEERARRLAAALRENLKRRKVQARGRDAETPSPSPAGAPDQAENDAEDAATRKADPGRE